MRWVRSVRKIDSESLCVNLSFFYWGTLPILHPVLHQIKSLSKNKWFAFKTYVSSLWKVHLKQLDGSYISVPVWDESSGVAPSIGPILAPHPWSVSTTTEQSTSPGHPNSDVHNGHPCNMAARVNTINTISIPIMKISQFPPGPTETSKKDESGKLQQCRVTMWHWNSLVTHFLVAVLLHGAKIKQWLNDWLLQFCSFRFDTLW